MSWNVEQKLYPSYVGEQAGADCGPPTREVGRSTASLHDSIGMLEMMAGELVTRLAPVLSELRTASEGKSAPGGPAPPQPCKLAGELESQAFRIRMVTECLSSALGRLEL